MKKFFNLVSDVDFSPIKTESYLCTRLRSPHNNCRRCQEVCMQEAISIEEDVKISYSKCNNCGKCYNSCPVGLFSIQEGSDAKLIGEGANILKGSKRLILACNKAELTRQEKKVSIRVNSLARISEGLLLKFLDLGFSYIHLNSGDCFACEEGGLILIERSKANVNNLLESIGDEKRIFFNSLDEGEVTEIPLKLNSIEDGEFEERSNSSMFDRRDLFNLLGSEVKRSFNGGDKVEKRSKREVKVSEDRRRVLSFLKKVSKDKKGSLGEEQSLLWNLDINKDCSFCGSCAKLCPTGALEMKGEEEKKLLLQPPLCVGCGLCEDVCFPKAIKLRKGRRIEDFLYDEKVSILEGVERKCSKCGSDFITAKSGDDELKCFRCFFQERLLAKNKRDKEGE